MTDENVEALPGVHIVSHKREEFLRKAARDFDRYVQAHGKEPDCSIHIFTGIGQVTSVGWLTLGESEGKTIECLCMGSMGLTRTIIQDYPSAFR